MLSPNNHCTGYLPPPLQTLCIGKSMEAVRLEICRCESVQILQAPNYCLAIASTRLLKAFNYLCYQQLPTIAVKSIAKSTQQGTSNKYCPILPVSISIGINISISIALYYHRYCRPVGIVGLSRWMAAPIWIKHIQIRLRRSPFSTPWWSSLGLLWWSPFSTQWWSSYSSLFIDHHFQTWLSWQWNNDHPFQHQDDHQYDHIDQNY